MFIYTVLFFAVGAALGSFSLVLAWRMHDKRDWVRGRSECDSCGHELAVGDLVPVISWLTLRGKCRYCKKPISKQIFLAESLLGLVTAVSWAFWPFELNNIAGYALFGLWLVCLTILSALFWYDYRWFILPSKLIYPLLFVSVFYLIVRGFVADYDLAEFLLLPLAGAVFLSGLFFVLHWLSGGKWIGFGDVRLAIPLGILIGSPILSWVMLFLASILGIIVALPGIVNGSKKMTSKIPFGPLLIMASYVVVVFGQSILDWYINLAGL